MGRDPATASKQEDSDFSLFWPSNLLLEPSIESQGHQRLRGLRDTIYKDRTKNSREGVGLGMENNQHNPIILFLGIYPRDIIIDESKELHTKMFFIELSVRVNK